MKKILTGPGIIFLIFAAFYVTWDFLTIRNIVHMDMLNVINYQIKRLYEHQLRASDLIFDPLFPCFTSIAFSLFNARFFHLNTVLESLSGCFFLVLLGYFYLGEMSRPLSGRRQKMLFALLVAFIVFGLHKWEAAFTSFFSFNVFFNLCICFFNYFLLSGISIPPGRNPDPVR